MKTCLQCHQPGLRFRQIGFGQHDTVSHSRLLDRFRVIIERRHTVDGIHRRQHAIKPESLHQHRMPHNRMQHRCRIGKASGLDDDPLQRLDTPGLETVDQVGQRIHQFTAHCAAQAAISKLDHTFACLLDKQVIDTNLTKFINDHRRIAKRRVFQKPVEQCRLAGAEKAGQHGNRNGISHIS